MATQIKLRRDTAANWAEYDPVLALGEPGYDTDNRVLKIGDGATVWSLLAALSGSGADLGTLVINGNTIDTQDTTGFVNLDNGGEFVIGTNNDMPLKVSLNGNGGAVNWTFATDGSVTFPDNTIQTTAFTGAGAANLGYFKISNSTLGTINDPDTGGWGAFWLNLDPGGESSSGISIPSTADQDGGSPLTIYNNKTSNSRISLNTQDGVLIYSNRGSVLLGADMEAPGAPSHFHIAFEGSNTSASPNELFLGDDFNYVKLISSGQGVEIGTNDRNTGGQQNWQFNSYDNALYAPDNSSIIQNYSVTRTAQGGVIGSGIIWSSSNGSAITSAKLTIQVEALEVGGDGATHTQVCEAIISGRLSGGEPSMTVYAVTHTSVDVLATFTIQRNSLSSVMDLILTPTAANASSSTQYRIHSVELYSRD